MIIKNISNDYLYITKRTRKKSTIIVLEAQSARFLGKSDNLFHLL